VAFHTKGRYSFCSQTSQFPNAYKAYDYAILRGLIHLRGVLARFHFTIIMPLLHPHYSTTNKDLVCQCENIEILNIHRLFLYRIFDLQCRRNACLHRLMLIGDGILEGRIIKQGIDDARLMPCTVR